MPLPTGCLVDPILMARDLWPDVHFYDKQVEVIDSVLWNNETYVPAGNQLGKDYVAGYIALWTLLAYPVVRIVTTSVKEDHLRVLWGEIGRYIQTCRAPLLRERGGPLRVNYQDIYKARPVVDMATGKTSIVECPISYLRGMVSKKGEGIAGHHAPHTLLIVDEASGVDNQVYSFGQGWAKRMLIFGNPNPTTADHFFYQGVKQGDLVADNPITVLA